MNMLHTPSDKLVSLIKTQYVALTEAQRATYINNTNREPNETGCVQGVFLHVGDNAQAFMRALMGGILSSAMCNTINAIRTENQMPGSYVAPIITVPPGL